MPGFGAKLHKPRVLGDFGRDSIDGENTIYLKIRYIYGKEVFPKPPGFWGML
jgi:hypothetical protein